MTYGELKTRAVELAKELGIGPSRSADGTYAAFFLEGFKAFYAYVWPSYGDTTTAINGTNKLSLETAGIAWPEQVSVAGVELKDRKGRPGPVPLPYIPTTPASGTPTEWAISSPGVILFDKSPSTSTNIKVTGALAAQTISNDSTVLELQTEWLNILAKWMALWVTQGTRIGSAQDVGDRMELSLVAEIARLTKADMRAPILRMRGEQK